MSKSCVSGKPGLPTAKPWRAAARRSGRCCAAARRANYATRRTMSWTPKSGAGSRSPLWPRPRGNREYAGIMAYCAGAAGIPDTRHKASSTRCRKRAPRCSAIPGRLRCCCRFQVVTRVPPPPYATVFSAPISPTPAAWTIGSRSASTTSPARAAPPPPTTGRSATAPNSSSGHYCNRASRNSPATAS